MSHNITELRPNLKLFVKNFEGYKLSLDTIPVIKNKLFPIHPSVITPNIDQYSLIHATLYGLHNHLYKDPFEPCTTYFIDTNNSINKYVFNRETQRFFIGEHCQFQLSQSEDLDKIYNSSMKVVSERYIVVCGGSNVVHIIDTIDRTKLDTWKIIFSQTVEVESKGLIIVDARLEEENGIKNIHCLLHHIEKAEKSFVNVVDWVVIKHDGDSSWTFNNHKQFSGKGVLQYCALENKSEAIYIVSDKKYKITLSEDQIKEEKSTNEQIENESNNDFINWHQSEEEITVIIAFKEFVDKKLLKVKTTNNLMNISYKEDYEIHLSEFIDPDLTTWSLVEANILEVNLYKISSKPWKTLSKNEKNIYKEIPNPAKVLEVHEQLKHLCSENQNETSAAPGAPIQNEIDDCDFDVDYDTKDWSLERFSQNSNTATHHVHIGSNGPLFSYSLLYNAPPIIALRHDVDGLLWEMPLSEKNWPPVNIGVLPAFGYVQASKQEKKFVSCSPDFNYSVICNGNRHVFIYWGDSNSTQLQNRISKQKIKIGTQKVVTLDNLGDIIGLQTENDVIMILTVDYIVALQLNPEYEP